MLVVVLEELRGWIAWWRSEGMLP